MKLHHTLLLSTLALALAGCSQPAPPPAPTPGDTASTDTPETFLGRKVKLAIDKARAELATRNISLNKEFSLGDGNNHGITIGSTSGKPKGDPRPLAEITPQGDLLIDGAKVEVTPEQHAMLLAYRGQIMEIAEAGMAMGVAGADLGGKALGGVAGAIFGGQKAAQDFEARMEAEGKRLEVEGRKLCERLGPLYTQQQALAASLPAFAPYATLSQAEVDDCGKDNEGAVAADPAGRDRIRDEIREQIRKEVRAEIQREMQGKPESAAPAQ